MSLEFIRASEAFAAEQPVAHEGSFTSMPSQVSPQVRCLPVDLSAVLDVADVHLLFARVVFAIAVGKRSLRSCNENG